MRSSIVSTITCLLIFSSAYAIPLHPLKRGAAASIAGYSYAGCCTETTDGRALNGSAFYDDKMTVEKCAAACEAYILFGVEYGRECYCGNTISLESALAPDDECSFTCPGNEAQSCGAGNRLGIYQKSAWGPSNTTNATAPYVSEGCYTEANESRALTGASSYNDTMTVELCASHCSGFTYFGVEYGRECYCGNSLQAGSAQTAEGDCSFSCAGKSSEKCGAGKRLNLYRFGVAISPLSNDTLKSSSWSTSTAVLTTATVTWSAPASSTPIDTPAVVSPTSIDTWSSISAAASTTPTVLSPNPSKTTCPSLPAATIPCDGTTNFTIQSSSNATSAYISPNSHPASTAVFVLEQDSGGCRLSTVSGSSPASPNILTEKKYHAVGLDGYVHLELHTSHGPNPLMACWVNRAGAWSCKLQ